jgi:2,5-diketo-D-gluconate reductase B
METVGNNHLRLPKLGLGTWQLRGAACRAAVEHALAHGYRHIDTARMYGNEEAVGAALAASGLPREQVQVTSKVWWSDLAEDAMRRTIEASLRDLRTDYVDLYLIHWPAPDMDLPKVFGALARLQEAGLARAIGASNFPVALLRRAVEEVGAPVASNQVEYHAMLGQSKVLAYARSKGIIITAYCPLAEGRLLRRPELADIARKHEATPAQIALAWLLRQDMVAAIPKAAHPANQLSNLQALEIHLDQEDLAAIAQLPKNERCTNPPWAPRWDTPD